MSKTHFFPKEVFHYTWNINHEPGLKIQSGDTVIFEKMEVFQKLSIIYI